MTRMTEHRAVESTIAEIRASRDRLGQDLARMQEEITDKANLLAYWEGRLLQLGNGDSPGPQRRMKKGEPLRRIREVYRNAEPASGFTIADLSEKVGIGWSSVRSVLIRTSRLFVEKDGLWHLREGLEEGT